MCALVTGVQTCALPILETRSARSASGGKYCSANGVSPSAPPSRGGDGFDMMRRNPRQLCCRLLEPLIILVCDGAKRQSAVRRSPKEFRVAIARRGQSACHRAHCIRSEEHTSELQSLMRTSYAVFCLKKKKEMSTRLKNST